MVVLAHLALEHQLHRFELLRSSSASLLLGQLADREPFICSITALFAAVASMASLPGSR